MTRNDKENRRNQRNMPTLLDEMLERRMLGYVLAAGAALAGATVTIAPGADAKVVFTPNNTRVEYGQTLHIDLNNDGTTDFTISFPSSSLDTLQDHARGRIRPPDCGNGVEIYAYGAIPSNEMEARGGGPAALVNGAKIPTGSFVKKGALAGLFYGSECHIYRFGYFYDTFDRFLGVKFMINGQVHYGWIGFRGVGVLFGLGAQLWGWAYETEPNTSIRAIDPSYTPS